MELNQTLQIQIIYTHLINVSISLIVPSPLAQGPVHIMDFDLRTFELLMNKQQQPSSFKYSLKTSLNVKYTE
jgi:hypothetical protein